VYRRSRYSVGLVAADLQAQFIALEDETNSLTMVMSHLEAEDTHCSEELAIFRLSIRELESLRLPPTAPEMEDQKMKAQSTKTKKTSSSRGDSPNSRKKKLRQQASDSSSEGEASKEDEVHLHVGLGPAVPGQQS
jgi:hypothetical protein